MKVFKNRNDVPNNDMVLVDANELITELENISHPNHIEDLKKKIEESIKQNK